MVEKSMQEKKICGKKMEIYSRIVGYFRPVANWNGGKREEFKDRLEYSVEKSMANKEVISPVSITEKTKTRKKELITA